MAKQPSRVAGQLKRLREEAGLTVEKLADEIGWVKSTYAYYEDDFKGEHLPMKLVKPLLEVLHSHGIAAQRVWALSGAAPHFSEIDVAHSENVGRAESHRPPTTKSSRLSRNSNDAPDTPIWPIEELDVRAGAGSGGGDTNHPIVIGGGTFIDAVSRVGEWGIPADLLRPVTRSPADVLKIITIVGDSMVPDFLPGQRVMVDTIDRTPSPPGVFAVWDGLAIVVKQVEYIAHSDPPRVLITSRNRDYQPYERVMDEAYIQGRVIGAWKWT